MFAQIIGYYQKHYEIIGLCYFVSGIIVYFIDLFIINRANKLLDTLKVDCYINIFVPLLSYFRLKRKMVNIPLNLKSLLLFHDILVIYLFVWVIYLFMMKRGIWRFKF
jgi:hypothetical protein